MEYKIYKGRDAMILGIYGAGGLAREVLEIVKLQKDYQSRWEGIVFIDDLNPSGKVREFRVFSFEEIMIKYNTNEIEFLIAVGEPFLRERLYLRIIQNKYCLTTLIHPTVTIPDSTILSGGVVIGAFTLISCDITIGANTYIQNHVSIGHDTIVGSHCVLSAGNAISGLCQIGDCTYVSMNVSVKDRIRIGSGTIVGMGSVVSREISDHVIAMGNPARTIKNNDDQRVFK